MLRVICAVLLTSAMGYKSVVQVTCPKSCTTCQCSGCKNVTVPLGKCAAAGQGAGVIGKCSSNGKTFTEEIYLNAKCQGQSATRSVINTAACIQTSETKQYVAFFCSEDAASEEKDQTIAEIAVLDPTYPPGKITVEVIVDAGTSYRPEASKSPYTVDQWANGVAGYDSDYAIYGSDNISDYKHEGLHEFSATLKSGTYVVEGTPLMWVCAFSPSANTYPLPAPADWRMGGCCYEFNAQNATQYNVCSDSKGPCDHMCTITSSGAQSDRHYSVHVSGQGPLTSTLLI